MHRYVVVVFFFSPGDLISLANEREKDFPFYRVFFFLDFIGVSSMTWTSFVQPGPIDAGIFFPEQSSFFFPDVPPPPKKTVKFFLFQL